MMTTVNISHLCKDSRFAEVLPTGLQFKGSSAGPEILVAAPKDLAEAVFKRLLNLPTLPWMSGAIRFVALDEAQSTFHGEETFDEMLCLPRVLDQELDEQSIHHALLTTLRLCAKLGMISGRGLGDPRLLAHVA